MGVRPGTIRLARQRFATAIAQGRRWQGRSTPSVRLSDRPGRVVHRRLRRLALRRRVQANAADLDIDSALWSAMGIEKRRELREAMAPRSGRMAPPLKMGDGHVCRRLRLHERTILAASTRVDDCDETAPSWPGTLAACRT